MGRGLVWGDWFFARASAYEIARERVAGRHILRDAAIDVEPPCLPHTSGCVVVSPSFVAWASSTVEAAVCVCAPAALMKATLLSDSPHSPAETNSSSSSPPRPLPARTAARAVLLPPWRHIRAPARSLLSSSVTTPRCAAQNEVLKYLATRVEHCGRASVHTDDALSSCRIRAAAPSARLAPPPAERAWTAQPAE